MKKTIIRNSLWLGIVAIAGRASWLLSLIIFAQAVGMSMYGEFIFYMTFWLVMSRVSGLGLEIWLNRHLAKENARSSGWIVNKILRLRAGLLFIGLIICGCGVYFAFPQYAAYTLIFVLVAFRQVSESLREVIVGALQGLQQMRLQALSGIPWDIAHLLIIVGLVYFINVNDMTVLASAMLVASAFRTLSLYVALNGMVRDDSGNSVENGFNTGSVLADSFFLGLGTLGALLLGKLYVIQLRAFESIETVGVVAFAMLFLEASIVLLSTVRQALFPVITSLAATDPARFIRVSKKSSWYFFLISMVMVFLTMAFTVWGIPVLFPEHIKDSEYIRWVMLLLPVVAVAGSVGSSVIAAGLSKMAVVAQVLGVLANFIVSVICIPVLGWKGALLGMALGYGVVAILNWRSVKSVSG